MTRLQKLWYISEVGIFLLYWGFFSIIGMGWLWGLLAAVSITALSIIVRKTLSKVKIEDE